MKLDRNINKDGHGKYALINLRTNMVEWGGPGGGFFVIKLHDKFAPAALRAYAEAVREEALNHGVGEAEFRRAAGLQEYANEIQALVEIAESLPNRKIPD